MASDAEQVAEVEAMFATHGFRLSVRRRSGWTVFLGRTGLSKYRYWVDLINLRTDRVAVANYGSGPSELLAIMATEQRWLIEQDGSASTPGKSYVDQAKERLRIGRTVQ
jgi:hypothetical protein